jgi:hypothetical protein
MSAVTSSTQVVNNVLQFVGEQVQITSLTDGSPAALAANVLYVPTVQLMLREIDPDFARFTGALTLISAPSQVPPWGFEYAYPATCIRLRQVRPPAAGGTGALSDINDPQPIRANVAYDGGNGKVILCNQLNALAVYTTSAVSEGVWDSVFTDAVVRRLANPLSMALAGRPDFAKTILEQSAMMAQTAEAVDEGGFRKF